MMMLKNYLNFVLRSVRLINWTLTNITSPGQSRSGRIGKKRLTPHSPDLQNWSPTTRTLFLSQWGSYPLTRDSDGVKIVGLQQYHLWMVV